MPTMGSYCKAYPASRFQEYPNWSEKPLPLQAESSTDPEARYFFLQENLIVTDGIFLDERIVFDNVTPEWEAFCKERLEFKVPDFHTPETPKAMEAISK
jgi:hypothetical protein